MTCFLLILLALGVGPIWYWVGYRQAKRNLPFVPSKPTL
jgi:hypothetical protein